MKYFRPKNVVNFYNTLPLYSCVYPIYLIWGDRPLPSFLPIDSISPSAFVLYRSHKACRNAWRWRRSVIG